MIFKLLIPVLIRLAQDSVAVPSRSLRLYDIVHLVCHLLVLLQEIWIHSVVFLLSAHLLVGLPVLLIEQSYWWIKHDQVFQVVRLSVALLARSPATQGQPMVLDM